MTLFLNMFAGVKEPDEKSYTQRTYSFEPTVELSKAPWFSLNIGYPQWNSTDGYKMWSIELSTIKFYFTVAYDVLLCQT